MGLLQTEAIRLQREPGRYWRYGLTVLAILVLAHSVWFAWRYFQPAPWLDMWDCIAEFEKWPDGAYGWRDLIAEHNDHRIATARVLFQMDALIFRMTGRFVVIVNMALLVGLGLVLHRLWRSDTVRGTAADLPAVFFVAAVTSVCQWENLVTPFQVQFALMCSFAALAVACLAAAGAGAYAPVTPRPAGARSGWLALAAATCFCLAAFSMAGGVLLLPIMLAVAVLRRLRVRDAVLFLVPSLAATALFFYHYLWHSLQTPLSAFHATPLRLGIGMAQTAAEFLGSAVAAFGEIWAIAAGLAGLLALAWCLAAAAAARGGGLRSGRAVALFALAGWVVLNAFAAGRLRLPYGALVSRYAVLSLVFFLCVGGVAVQATFRGSFGGRGIAGRSPLVPALAALGLLAANVSPAYERQADGLRQLLAIAASTLRAGVYAPGLLNILNPFGLGPVLPGVRFVQRHRLSVFAESGRPPRAVRDALRGADPARLPACAGGLDMLYRLDASRSVVQGWAAMGGHTADWVEILDHTGRAVGVLPALENRDNLPLAGGHGMGVLGALAGGMADGPATLVGVFDGGALCGLAVRGPGPVRVEPLAAGPHDSLKLDGVPPAGSLLPGLAPPWPGAPYWTDAAAAGPELALRVAPPGAGLGLAVPFATGQDSAGQSVHFAFADGAHADLPVPSDTQPAHWRLAALPADMLARHPGPLSIAARDSSRGPGRWLALGPPFAKRLDPDAARLP